MDEEKVVAALFTIAEYIEKLQHGETITKDIFIQLNDILEG